MKLSKEGKEYITEMLLADRNQLHRDIEIYTEEQNSTRLQQTFVELKLLDQVLEDLGY